MIRICERGLLTTMGGSPFLLLVSLNVMHDLVADLYNSLTRFWLEHPNVSVLRWQSKFFRQELVSLMPIHYFVFPLPELIKGFVCLVLPFSKISIGKSSHSPCCAFVAPNIGITWAADIDWSE